MNPNTMISKQEAIEFRLFKLAMLHKWGLTMKDVRRNLRVRNHNSDFMDFPVSE